MLPGRLLILALLLAAISLGCGQSPPSTAEPAAMPTITTSAAAEPIPAPAALQKPAADQTANEILARLLTTYREAKTYQDQGVLRLSFRQNGQPVAQEWPVAVAYERPNKISIQAYQVVVKCDGTEFKARIDDPTSNNVDRQVVVRPAPPELKLVEFASDELLHSILSSRLRRQPIQLELLLESSGLVSAFKADVVCERLPDATHADHTCYRVSVPSPGGAFTFWVDQKRSLLVRLDYPAAALAPELANDSSVGELSLYADLRDAVLNKPVEASQFALVVPADARRMKTFVVPPQPLPSDLFGQQPREFFFTQLDGAKLSDRDLLGKIAVLVWYHDNPACEATLGQVSAARQRLKDDDAVQFFAVATDPTATNADALKRRLATWQVELPIVRDLDAFGDKSFHIEVQPTIVVLDPRGKVQIFQAGGSPELADQLVTIVGRLKRGEDQAAEIIARHEGEQRQYEQLVARGGPEPGEVLEVPEAVIRRASEPKKLRLTQLWKSSELTAPGNLLIAPAGDDAKVLVVEGWRAVGELDGSGKLIARHELELPEQAAITFLRTTTDGSGKRILLAAAPLAPQVYLFDDQFKRLRSFPPADQTPLRLVDAAFADLGDSDGTPEILAANVGDIGLLALSLGGEVVWRNRVFPNVFACAPTKLDVGGLAIFLAGENGTVLRVNRFGHEEPPVTVANRAIARLFGGAAFTPQATGRLLGIASNAKGEPLAIGLSDALKEQWNYPLPLGVHQKPIEPVIASQMLPGYSGEWWLAGPDGSIHMITEDGRLFDSFHLGAAPTGIAAGKIGDTPLLIIATESGITAWRVEALATPRGREF
jgi:hypothetical protein